MKPGETRNPNGRPLKDWTWDSLYIEAVEESDETGIPIKKIIAKKLAKMAARGDLGAIKELTNRTDGMPVAKTDLTSGGEKISAPIAISSDAITAIVAEAEKKIKEQILKSNK